MGKYLLLIAAICCCLVSGCRSNKNDTPEALINPAELTASERSEAQATAIRWGEDVLKGMKEGDYTLLSTNFAPRLRERFSEDMFKKLRSGLGTVEDSRFLTVLSTPKFETYVWKVTVCRKVEAKEYRGDILMRLTIMKENGKYHIAGLHFG